MSISINEVFWYVVGQPSSTICITVAVASHHLLLPYTGASVFDNFVHEIQAVSFVAGFFRVRFKAWFFFNLPLFFPLFLAVGSVEVAS